MEKFYPPAMVASEATYSESSAERGRKQEHRQKHTVWSFHRQEDRREVGCLLRNSTGALHSNILSLREVEERFEGREHRHLRFGV